MLAIEDESEVAVAARVHVDVVSYHIDGVVWDHIPLDVDRIQATQLVDFDEVEWRSRIGSEGEDGLI